MSRIFINYRRQDSEGYVGRLYDHLCQHFEAAQVFMDVDSIRPGVDFVAAIENAIANCDLVMAIIGPQWLTLIDEDGARRLDDPHDFVRLEIETALKHEKPIIPVLVGQAKMPSGRDLPTSMASFGRRSALELTHSRFTYDVQQLVHAVKTALVPARPSSKPRSNPETLRGKLRALKDLRDRLFEAKDSPYYAYRIANGYFPVLGDGNPDANLMFIGQAPAEYEAIQGKPFIGPSGDVLDQMLQTISLRRDDAYLTNVVLDRPPDNRDPVPAEIDFYAPYLDRLIEIVQPGVIIPLGRFAMGYVLRKYDLPEKRLRIGQLHGKLLKTSTTHGTLFILPLYHPAMVLYSPNERETLRRDFQQLKPFVDS